MLPDNRRSPHGERGLKSEIKALGVQKGRSLPARGAWIEITFVAAVDAADPSLPARGAWIEM